MVAKKIQGTISLIQKSHLDWIKTRAMTLLSLDCCCDVILELQVISHPAVDQQQAAVAGITATVSGAACVTPAAVHRDAGHHQTAAWSSSVSGHCRL